MYELWYDYIKPKYGEKAKLFYMDTNSYIVHLKTDDIYKNIAEDFETRFLTLQIMKQIDRCLWEKINKWTNHEKLVGLRAKAYNYLTENDDEYKKAKTAKECHQKNSHI